MPVCWSAQKAPVPQGQPQQEGELAASRWGCCQLGSNRQPAAPPSGTRPGIVMALKGVPWHHPSMCICSIQDLAQGHSLPQLEKSLCSAEILPGPEPSLPEPTSLILCSVNQSRPVLTPAFPYSPQTMISQIAYLASIGSSSHVGA